MAANNNNSLKKPRQSAWRAMEHLVCDPLGFVYFAYPWGSGTLSGSTGPDAWQAEILSEVGKDSESAKTAVMCAVSSGHGTGKTALVSWLIHWFISTRPHPQIVVTANTRQQLETKTWRELAKWHKLSRHREHFLWTANKFYQKAHPETWFAAAIPWGKERSEAFAGTHEKHVLVIYDEASLIDDAIWEVTEGAMTTPGAMWFAFGNPTRNTGRFRECFGRFRHRWHTWKVDSRNAKMANRQQIDQWVADYGEDSDFVRVRVRGELTRASSMQFIAQNLVDAAQGRTVPRAQMRHAAVVIGVDVARYGDDQSVIYVRQGLATLEVKKYRGLDLITLGNLVAGAETRYGASAVFVDSVGIGAGVVDFLRGIGRSPVGVNAGRQSPSTQYANMRAHMWGCMREWLMEGGTIPNDPELAADLTAPEFAYDARERIQLEKKEHMKSRGLASPDTADALALTFAAPVSNPDPRENRHTGGLGGPLAQTDYNIFGE